MAAKQPPPALRRHARGSGFVQYRGKRHYLGPHGTPECRRRYDDLLAKWGFGDPDQLTARIDDLAIAFQRHADGYYRRPDGTPTGTADNIRDALRPLVEGFGTTLVCRFTPRDLKTLRERLVRDGLCRRTVNDRISTVKATFKWGVSEGIVPVEVWQALTALAGLRAGRSEARESDGIQPVAVETVEATIPHLPRPVQGLVRLQLHTGCRPSEACILRACDLDTSGDVWLYTPQRHKNEHRGKSRMIALGPKAQQVVREFLVTDTTAYLFRPVDAPRTRSRNLRDHYTADPYRRAVQRGCEVAFGMPDELRNLDKARLAKRKEPPTEAELADLFKRAREWRRGHCWTPLQLRHTAATLVRRRFGLEAAQVVLGHARADVTQMYAEANVEKAMAVALAIG